MHGAALTLPQPPHATPRRRSRRAFRVLPGFGLTMGCTLLYVSLIVLLPLSAAFLRSAGCHGLHLVRSVENPSKFVLHVQWESVAHHMEIFRNAPEFQEWRENVGHCFAAPPNVWHGQAVA